MYGQAGGAGSAEDVLNDFDFDAHVTFHSNYSTNSLCASTPNTGEPKIRRFGYDSKFGQVLGKEHRYRIKGLPSDVANEGWSWEVTTKATQTALQATAPGGKLGYSSSGADSALLAYATGPVPYSLFGPTEIEAASGDGRVEVRYEGDNSALFFDRYEKIDGQPGFVHYWSKDPYVDSLARLLPEVYVLNPEKNKFECDSVMIRPGVDLAFKPGLDDSLTVLESVRQPGKLFYNGTIARTEEYRGAVYEVPNLHHSGRAYCEHYGDSVMVNAGLNRDLLIWLSSAAALPNENGLSGIEHFYEKVTHEFLHLRIKGESRGYGLTFVDTDSDGYDDRWERDFAQRYPDMVSDFGINFTISKDTVDRYDKKYTSCFDNMHSASIKPRAGHNCSAGTLFEEIYIRQIQYGLDFERFRKLDWSYDPGTLKLENEDTNQPMTVEEVNVNWINSVR